MELPVELKKIIEEKIDGLKRAKLIEDAKRISERYRYESGQGQRLVSLENEALVYSLVRMPATFGAIYKALNSTLECIDTIPRTLLDVGSGTGAGVFAADQLIHLNAITCLEREMAMIQVGQSLTSQMPGIVNKAQWIQYDLNHEVPLPQAELVLISYVLNELPLELCQQTVKKLYEASQNVLLIVEPGTPVAFERLKMIREQLIELGAQIIAPCPSHQSCPLEQDDWCHFTTRIPRSQIHKQLKEGDVPYEDEKFCYLAVSKTPVTTHQQRVLRHPIFEKGRVTLKLCTIDGVKTQTVRKSEKEKYKKARKISSGDSF